MEDQTLTIGIDLHYFMDNDQRHEMDASIHNKCEACILDALNHLGELFNEDIRIDVSALEEGGVIDKFKIILKNKTVKDLFLLLCGALISHFIGVSPSLCRSACASILRTSSPSRLRAGTPRRQPANRHGNRKGSRSYMP